MTGRLQVSDEEIEALITRAVKLLRPEYLTRDEMAKELKVSRPKLRQLEEQGLPVHHLGGNIYRFFRPEVQEWVKSNPAQMEDKAS